MDFSRLNSWLQVSANIGIVLGLLLVGVQLKQNSDLARIQLLYDESRRVVEFELEMVGERAAEVWAKSIEDPENLTLEEVRIMEALYYSFIENLRGTYRLAQLGLLEDSDWRSRVESEVNFYISDPYALSWWSVFGGNPNESIPEELRAAINAAIADDEVSVTDYILAPQRRMKSSTPAE